MFVFILDFCPVAPPRIPDNSHVSSFENGFIFFQCNTGYTSDASESRFCNGNSEWGLGSLAMTCAGRSLWCTQILIFYYVKSTHQILYIYRPQRSRGKVMFLHLSVILFTGGLSGTPLGRHPQCMLGYTPSTQCMLGYTPPYPVHAGIHTTLPSACWDMVNKRAVRILLECILVSHVSFIFFILEFSTTSTLNFISLTSENLPSTQS